MKRLLLFALVVFIVGRALMGIVILHAEQAPKVPDIVRVQVVFTEDTECGRYRDALYFTPAEYAGLKAETLAAMKQTRVDTFVDRIKNPPPPVEPTKEQLEAEVVEVQKQKESLDARLVELAALIAAKDKVVGKLGVIR